MNIPFLRRWLACSALAFLAAAAVSLALSPCALLTMIGSGFLGAYVLYHLSVLLLCGATASLQAVLLKRMGPFGLPWIASVTLGWLLGAILGSALPFSTAGLVSLWFAGGLLSGVLQWAAVFRSVRSLLWIPASLVAALATPAVALLLSYALSLASPASASPAAQATQAMFADFLLGALATAAIAFISIMSSSAIGGVMYSLIFKPKILQAA